MVGLENNLQQGYSKWQRKERKEGSGWKPGASFSKNTGLHVAYVFESFSPFYMKALQQWKYIPGYFENWGIH